MALIISNSCRNNFHRSDSYFVCFLRFDFECIRSNFFAYVHGIHREISILACRNFNGHFSIFCNYFTIYHYSLYTERLQIIHKNNVCTFSRSYGTQLMIHLETLCTVNCNHLNCFYRINTFGDSSSYNMVEMSVSNQRMRVCIIRNKYCIS